MTTPLITFGLMSGTSLDGVDAVAVRFAHAELQVLGHAFVPYASSFRERLLALCTSGPDEIERAGALAGELAQHYAKVTQTLLTQTALTPQDVAAIGVHGQTIRHRPQKGYSVQLNHPSLLAELTGIDVICDFRARDIAAHGEGAPLVPAFHRALFTGKKPRAILNLGGIANVTILPARNDTTQRVQGGDTGPANMLLDTLMRARLGEPFDRDGAIAAQGHIHEGLLEVALQDPYFARPFPKSTGRETFNEAWLWPLIERFPLSTQDLMRTLVELTARSAIEAIERSAPETQCLYVCGGGALNPVIMHALSERFKGVVDSTERLGLPPMQVEATAFAWLAKAFLERTPGNLPDVTGAKGSRILGALYPR